MAEDRLRKGRGAVRPMPAATSQKLLKNKLCSGGSRSFAKETRALKVRSTVASRQKLTTTN